MMNKIKTLQIKKIKKTIKANRSIKNCPKNKQMNTDYYLINEKHQQQNNKQALHKKQIKYKK